MTTYVYATIPQHPGEQPRHYEIKQSMKDTPLTQHPETGEAIRRVIRGGFGILGSGKSSQPRPPSRGGCGGGCGCGC
jgi:predicted nucleic acid-binding Zn ribbon protein